MLKTRVIPILLFRNWVLVKSIKFETLRNIGIPVQAARVYNSREVDELVFLDITATNENRGPMLDIIHEVAGHCFMPLTVGGGIKAITDVVNVLKQGADKISINTAAIKRPSFITDAAKLIGSQSVIVSMDIKLNAHNDYEVFSNSGKVPTGLNPVRWAEEAEGLGAGEILLTSIDRDGTMEGYDLELIRRVSEAVNIPVIAAGGAGTLQHFVDCMKIGKASAAAASSIFHYTQITPNNVKQYMRNSGIDVRITLGFV